MAFRVSLYGMLMLLLAGLAPAPCTAGADADFPQLHWFFPEADQFGAFEGDPPAAEARRAGALIGYALLTDQVVAIPGYSGQPLSTLVGFDTQGVVRGVRIVRHEEPILVIGVKPADLSHFVDQYRGLRVDRRVKLGGAPREGYATVDGISGATITAIVLNASIMRSVREVMKARGIEALPANAQAPKGAEPDTLPLWEATWEERRVEILGLCLGLTVLTLMLLFQDVLVRRPRLLRILRNGFLLYTLFYLGWYALAQLSVVNVLTFIRALMHDFRWETFLIDPILFILWGFVALILLLWGRGVYCGWLCPFGALQELVFQIARRLHLPAFELPQLVHDRLWALKYVIFVILFGLSMQSLDTALPYSEVEPFKTVFSLRFMREWPFVLYALALILVSAFNRKFFCKYLCPLGAALAIPSGLKLFDWLWRRKECGRPCQICAQECEVRAIRATGEINAHECHYCMDCQVTYYNDHVCPPVVERRKRKERHARKPNPGEAVVVRHEDVK